MPERRNSTPVQEDADILEVLRDNWTTLELTISGSELVYTSYLLAVGGQWLELDQLIPGTGDELLQPAVPIKIRASQGGVRYRFTTQYLASAVDAAGLPYHKVALPTKIESADKRASFRIPVQRMESPDFQISFAPGQTSMSLVEDISEGGACLRVVSEKVPPGGVRAVSVSIALGEGVSLRYSARVCYVQPIAESNLSRVGLAFRNVSARDARKLRVFLMHLQRRNIRAGFVL